MTNPLSATRAGRRWAWPHSHAGPLLLSASTATALARLISHGLSLRVLGPMVAAIAVADVTTSLAMRRRPSLALSVVIGSVASLLMLTALVDPSLLFPGSSHFGHANVLGTQFRAARYELANEGTPLPRINGVIVGVGELGGLVAALTQAVWVRRTRSSRSTSGRTGALGPVIGPSFALFLYSSLVSSDQGRTIAAVSYFIGVLLFVALADRSLPLARPQASTRRRHIDVGTALCGAVAMAVVIGAGAGLSGMHLTVFHVTPPSKTNGVGQVTSPNGVPTGLLSGLDLVDDLRALELSDSNTVIFRAQSPLATYWQVGTLSTFNGTQWLPSPGVDAALAGSPSVQASTLAAGALPEPSPSSFPNFSAQVVITNLYSRLLPAPPHVISVSRLAGAQVIAGQGVLSRSPTGAGTTYAVSAWLNTTGSIEGTPLRATDPRLAPYLALPAEPAVVSQLAHAAVGHITAPAFEVQALVNWFRSGQFRYTLSPPPTTGANPLVQFLTVTKAGYCQQFAGAFGVLARTLGIPTRLAVGFLAGQPSGGNSFIITGADAHVWPQVYLGPSGGWVSVEPTPATVHGAAAPLGVLEPSTGPQAAGEPTPVSPPTSVPGSTVTSTPTQPAGGTSAKGGSGHHVPTRVHARASSTPWLLIIAGAAVILLALIGLLEVRRRRGRQPGGLSPDAQVVRAWERALQAMRHHGLPRRLAETPSEYVARLRDSPASAAFVAGVDALAGLAALVEQACYTPWPCTAVQAEEAMGLVTTVLASDRRHRVPAH
jgi:transglutaminase superfamily protein/uncharacterized protein DUF4129/transglutaminase TgpA-like protein